MGHSTEIEYSDREPFREIKVWKHMRSMIVQLWKLMKIGKEMIKRAL